METNKRLEVKEVKRKEPECTAIRSSSYKNVVIGVITGAVMLVNGWIEVDSKAGQLLVALGMVILVTLLMHCTDEILNEQVD